MRFISGKASRRAAVAGLAGVAALALAACSSDSEPAASESGSSDDVAMEAPEYGDLAVQLSWIKNEEFSGEFFADTNGYYTEAGFDAVTLTPGPSTGVAELLSGSTDVALSDAVSIGSAVAAEEAPLKIIGTTYQKNPFTVLSLADGGNIVTAEDMVGKKIGVQDSNTALFMALLAANGLTEDDLEIVPVQYDPAPLTNGEVDGFIAYLTNESITVEAAGYDTVNLPFADNGLPFVAETFTVTDQAIAEDREKLKAFLVAEIKGWTDAVNDPEEGARLAYEVYGADLELNPENSIAGAIAQAEDLVVSDETASAGLFTISDALQASTIESLAGAGIELEPADLFDLSLLAEVYEEHPELVAYAG
ncbi:ABC transporter substrate-binding protein [Demequina mangrovi]|uniref:Thiamine pyrimidine synthase n=1 Tax=Demequina mangrovi TaxID=1043493 RepID=A0A1H6XHU4_9MICO|nr:ABC transporter substrate-binding protein [Demequina mangrovi]SEJ24450.1 ABC-type nitrate/sulfonate/bicarbonate transport system, substrate-binding protein [Demequina mangrovi]